MSLAAIAGYGSDGSDADDGEPRAVPAAPVAPAGALSLPAPRQGGGGDGAPDAKRPRRAFQLPLPAPKHNAPVSDGESSDDEDAKRFAASRKGGGLLASVSRPRCSHR
jgi:hypothetical protein